MTQQRPAPKGHSGMTIMEVLVVLIIFGICWFAILPNLNLLDRSKPGDPGLDRLNTFMAEARIQAMHQNSIEHLTLIPGKRILVWGKASTTFPSTVLRCQVNGHLSYDRPAEFRVYPTGSMDDVRVILDGGATLASNVLSAEFEATR